MRYRYVMALLGLVVGGCEKYSGPTEVSGYVVDRHTRQPVAGAKVWVVGASLGWAGVIRPLHKKVGPAAKTGPASGTGEATVLSWRCRRG